MSRSIDVGQPAMVTVGTAGSTRGLPSLYLVRFGFAIGWAGLVALTASTLNPASIALLVVYPLFDLVAAAIDISSVLRVWGVAGYATLGAIFFLISAFRLQRRPREQ